MNETARWVEANWDELEEKLRSTFTSYFHEDTIRLDTDDWIQEFIAHLIEKDPIPKYLAKGAPSKSGQRLTYIVAYWGFCYVCTLIKRQAMDTVARLYTGALTEREYSQKATPSELVLFDELEDHPAPDPPPDQACSVQELAEVTLWWMSMCFPISRERYMTVLGQVLQGSSILEIGMAEGVSRHRAASIVGELRRRLRHAADTPENFCGPEYVRVA